MLNLTIGYIEYKKDVLEDYFIPSLQKLIEYNSQFKNDVKIIHTDCEETPAKNYNKMIDMCTTKYLLLTHTDVTFSEDLLLCIENTINYLDDKFAALGIVGVCDKGTIHWSNVNSIYLLETLDCCCILINKEHGLRFDEVNFDDFHLYVEDYCINAKTITGLNCHSLMINASEVSPKMKYKDLYKKKSFYNHHSYTLNQRGACWGKYFHYRKILNKKWGRAIATT
ncbi:MAG: hypothetical protein IT243_05985 [Bacteroidia bacterium]|nr:hypothetical protein [Bacteroidia bacterium]